MPALPQIWGQNGHFQRQLNGQDKVRAVKIIERDDDAEHGGEWSIRVEMMEHFCGYCGLPWGLWGGFRWLHGHNVVCPVPIGSSNDRPMPQNVGSTPENERLDFLKIHRFCQGKSFEPNLHECVPC